MPVDEYDSDWDIMPDGAWSECDNEDDANPMDVAQPVEDYDSDEDEIDNDEARQCVEQGFQIC